MSSRAGRSRLEVLTENQERRQRILDFLNAHGPAYSSEIAAATGDSCACVKATLKQMLPRGEICKEGTHRTARFTALVETTMSAQDMDAMIRAGKVRAPAKPKPKPQTAKPAEQRSVAAGGIHYSGDHPLKNQGGQGALRRSVFVNLSNSY